MLRGRGVILNPRPPGNSFLMSSASSTEEYSSCLSESDQDMESQRLPNGQLSDLEERVARLALAVDRLYKEITATQWHIAKLNTLTRSEQTQTLPVSSVQIGALQRAIQQLSTPYSRLRQGLDIIIEKVEKSGSKPSKSEDLSAGETQQT